MTPEKREELVTSPSRGVYQVYRPSQRPVEGVAVYYYHNGIWKCESHGVRRDCWHIEMAKEFSNGN